MDLGHLKSGRMICFKAVLFLVAGGMASAVLLLRRPELLDAALLVAAVWCFCRAYFFSFHVFQKWVDPSYRFAGILSLVVHLVLRRRGVPPPAWMRGED